jgi:hypothetical protein
MSVFLFVVTPCLNAAEALSTVLRKVRKAMRLLPNDTYELIVASMAGPD